MTCSLCGKPLTDHAFAEPCDTPLGAGEPQPVTSQDVTVVASFGKPDFIFFSTAPNFDEDEHDWTKDADRAYQEWVDGMTPLGAGEPSPETPGGQRENGEPAGRAGEAVGAEQEPHPVRPSPAPSGVEFCPECGYMVGNCPTACSLAPPLRKAT